jgi:uroporphyrinogen decarboxylase
MPVRLGGGLPGMTGSERILAALEGRWADRRPVMLHNFMPAAREAGLTMKRFRKGPEKAARALIDATEKYDLDGVLIDFDTATLAGAVGVGVDFPEDAPARAVKPRLARLEQLAELDPPDIAGDERIAIWVESCRLVKAHFGDAKFVRGNCDQAPFSLASMMRSPTEWMMDLVPGTQDAFRLLEYCAEACVRFLRLVAGTGVDMLSNGDSPAGPSMISPAMYRRFALPYEKRLADESHRLGLPYLIHICGDTTRILPDMAETGADALELDYKTDARAVRRVCGERMTLFGNIDPVGVLLNGSPELVDSKVDELLAVYADCPRLALNAGCALPPDTPEENIRRLVARAG